jgi:hypothetical protein
MYSQAQTGNAVVITTLELNLDSGGTIAEFDSLSALYTEKVIKRNEHILSHRTVRHWWGHNNRDFLVIYEVKGWEDIPKANQRNNELFRESWETPEERKQFNDAYNKYFTGNHSDEIYQEVKSGRK